MPRYVTLASWTDQGIRNVKDTIQRAQQTQQLVEAAGGWIEIFWTLGRYDIVAMSELLDDETATALTLRIAGGGNLRTEVLRAFDAGEMERIIEKMA